MIDVYIVRHGESIANEQGILAGHTDVQLSLKGIEQSQILKQYLCKENIFIDQIFSSPLQRAYNTIQPYSDTKGIEIIIDDRLKELYLGNKEQRPAIELFSDDFHQDPFYFRDSDGYESYDDCRIRVQEFLHEKIYPQKGKKILISCHAGVLRSFIAVLNNLTREVPFLRVQNASLTHYRIDELTRIARCEKFCYDVYLREKDLI